MLRLFSLLIVAAAASGLTTPARVAMPSTALRTPVRAAAVQMQFGKKKKPLTLEERGYWGGEWVCADCGYIYEPGTEPPFEELRPRWKCPQCAGPRRRFVKKAGNMVGQVDDSPLIGGTIGAAILIIVLVYVGLTI
ncbi:hypothetical protein AB1Y20_003688 [Prymnesium parvum]|uniref:Rubredoxin-like domain-containing protein n=1 Tax=Prymnesium parvum TaxID=97485 RepID=A0AB34J5A5_PRYPA